MRKQTSASIANSRRCPPRYSQNSSSVCPSLEYKGLHVFKPIISPVLTVAKATFPNADCSCLRRLLASAKDLLLMVVTFFRVSSRSEIVFNFRPSEIPMRISEALRRNATPRTSNSESRLTVFVTPSMCCSSEPSDSVHWRTAFCSLQAKPTLTTVANVH